MTWIGSKLHWFVNKAGPVQQVYSIIMNIPTPNLSVEDVWKDISISQIILYMVAKLMTIQTDESTTDKNCD